MVDKACDNGRGTIKDDATGVHCGEDQPWEKPL